MDTILYFYPLKHETSQTAVRCKVAEYQFPIYHLVKIGMPPKAVSLLQDTFEKPQRFLFLGFLDNRKRKKEWEMQRQELLDSIFKLWGESCSSYCVCQRPITYFDKWKFTDYREEKWVDYLMRYGTWCHYVVLGNAPCLQTVLPKYVKKMKSLRMFLKESEFDEELEELLEWLFEEYGLTADIHFLEENNGYKKLPALGVFPCNVLDFSGEENVSSWSAAPESIWLDFDGMEEKRRRFESRGGKVDYFSLQKEWKLDTAKKNGYNTIVKE